MPAPVSDGGSLIEENPDWTERERAVYRAICAGTLRGLTEPLPWAQMQDRALAILAEAAAALSDGRRGAMDFSVPEALLLADRILRDSRHVLRTYVPMADTFKVSTVLSLWESRKHSGTIGTVAKLGYRAYRSMNNLPAAAIKELQNLVLGCPSDSLMKQGELQLQLFLLEAVARAATDLHSGHLRFTEAELLEIELSSHLTDLAHHAGEDLPLRLLVVGQVSAGKSSLINALLRETVAEVDLSPTTPGLVRREVMLSGTAFSLVDTQGIDGSPGVADRLLAEMLEADLLLWVVRANRPAREEGIPAGTSAGAILRAATALARRPEVADRTIVASLPDSGERCLTAARRPG